jgi:hypothetical protein
MKLIYTLAVAAVLAFAMPSTFYAVPAATAATSTQTIPDVKYPFTFVCAHCGIKITLKSKDDWSKPCAACPCGTTNLGCYKPGKK